MSVQTHIERYRAMFELPASDFVQVVMEIKRLGTLLDQYAADADDEAEAGIKSRMADTIGSMRNHLVTIGDTSAWVAADRFHKILEDPERALKFSEIRQHIRDIEGRFADHLNFIRLFVVRGEQLMLLGGPAELIGEPTASRFTSVWFDCEEAAKCLCLQRPTAAVFHCMRMLEIGIKAFCARLQIPDPVKPSQRNWAIILGSIKAKIDSEYPASQRTSGSEGAFLEGLHATLDAVKNPWRNEVMHVEGVYTDVEARFILACAATFIQKMATGFDENGDQVDAPVLLP